ncbi:hypothetical protein HDU91_002301 [Kappamyces sp. JEL0680]|nr:hypothetical protein HDU91_002301 [Kappamyces sp. JEL0680]
MEPAMESAMEPTPKSSFEPLSSQPFLPPKRPSNLPYEQLKDEEDHAVKSREALQDYRVKRLQMAVGFCLFLFIVQFIGGWISSSLALMADAFHMLSDVIGYVISLTSILLANSPATRNLPYGRKRIEVLGALASIALLWFLSFGLVAEAWERLQNPKAIDGKTMLIMAIGGVIVNGLLIGIFGHEMDGPLEEDKRSSSLLEEGKGESASFQEIHLSPDDSAQSGTGGFSEHTKNDINMRAAMLHAIGDLLCSIGVFISALVIVYKPEWRWIDPLCTFVFAVMAIFTTLSVLQDIGSVLMQCGSVRCSSLATPSDLDVDAIQQDFLTIKGVFAVESIQCWALTQKDRVASVKLAVSVSSPFQIAVIVGEARKILKRQGIDQSTIETQVQVHSIV